MPSSFNRLQRTAGIPILAQLFRIASVAISVHVSAQNLENGRAFRAEDGLGDTSSLAITVSPGGNVIVTHREADQISILDGYGVEVIDADGAGAYQVHQNRTDQLWSIYDEGIQVYQNSEWRKFPVPAIERENRKTVLPVTDAVPIWPMQYNHALVLLPDQLIEFEALPGPTEFRTGRIIGADEAAIGSFLGLLVTGEDDVSILGERGIIKFSGKARTLIDDNARSEFVLPGSLEVANLKRPVASRDGGIVCIGESTATKVAAVVKFSENNWSVFSIGTENVRWAWEHSPGRVLGFTSREVLQIGNGGATVVDSRELPISPYRNLAVHPDGSFWITGLGGVYRFAELPWQAPDGLGPLSSPVFSLLEFGRDRTGFITDSALFIQSDGGWDQIKLPEDLTGLGDEAGTLVSFADGAVYLKHGNDVFEIDPDAGPQQFFSPGRFDGATIAGKTFDRRPIVLRAGTGPAELMVPEGEVISLPPDFSLPAGARAYQTRTREVWLFGDRDAHRFVEGEWVRYGPEDGVLTSYVRTVLEKQNGDLWFGGRNGILSFNGQRFEIVRTGLEQVNRMVEASDGSIWVATARGLLRYVDGSWNENDERDGLASSTAFDVMEDSQRRIWAGTNRGISLYGPRADPDFPDSRILTENTSISPEADNSITLEFSGVDKWKMTDASQLLYSYQIDSSAWSAYQSGTSVTFTDLAAGTHRFQVKAIDRNWNVELIPAMLTFEVILPWSRDPRLIGSLVVTGGLILLLAVFAVRGHFQLRRSYAEVEQIVEKRSRELEIANQQLLHTQKMRAMGTLAAGVAHDFNSILSIIKGSAQIIGRDPADKDKVQTRVGRISLMVEQGSQLVNAMLGFSHYDERPLSECELGTVVRQTVSALGDRLPEEINIELRLGENVPGVFAPKDVIQQMLINLLLNAAEAREGNGTIIVTIRQVAALPGVMVVRPADASSWAEISVQDFGQGIPEENLGRIFEPFFTTKSRSERKGTGLGLLMVHEFAREMGFGLKVESTLGKSTTFSIFIPVVRPSTVKGDGTARSGPKGA